MNGWNWLFAWAPFLTLADYRPINWLIDVQSAGHVLGDLRLHVGAPWLLHAHSARRPAGDPKDLYEAAEMDGTSKSRQFWRITLPLLMPTMIVVLVLSLIRAFQVFDEVYVLTGGGPGQATKMIIQHIYEKRLHRRCQALRHRSRLLGMVPGLLLVLTLIQLTVTRKRAGG